LCEELSASVGTTGPEKPPTSPDMEIDIFILGRYDAHQPHERTVASVSIAVQYPDNGAPFTPPPDLREPRDRVRLTPAAVEGLQRIAAAWGLTVEQTCGLLGDVPASTWYSWVARPPRDLGVDRLTRVSYLLGIHQALHVLYPNSVLADQWVGRPNTNPLFAGRAPLDVLLEGGIAAMDRTRSLLDARRGA